jgi:hypothetical protein
MENDALLLHTVKLLLIPALGAVTCETVTVAELAAHGAVPLTV